MNFRTPLHVVLTLLLFTLLLGVAFFRNDVSEQGYTYKARTYVAPNKRIAPSATNGTATLNSGNAGTKSDRTAIETVKAKPEAPKRASSQAPSTDSSAAPISAPAR